MFTAPDRAALDALGPDKLQHALSTWLRADGDDPTALLALRDHLSAGGLAVQLQPLTTARGVPALWARDARREALVLVRRGSPTQVRVAFQTLLQLAQGDAAVLLAPDPETTAADLLATASRAPVLADLDGRIARQRWFVPPMPVRSALEQVEAFVELVGTAFDEDEARPFPGPDRADAVWSAVDAAVMRLRGWLPPGEPIPEEGLSPVYLLCGLGLAATEALRRSAGERRFQLVGSSGNPTLAGVGYRPPTILGTEGVNLSRATFDRFFQGSRVSVAAVAARALASTRTAAA